MIRYTYNLQKQPPAPFVLVTMRHPRSGAEARDLPAQIDTAADRTLLPLALVQALALDKIGDMDIGGVGGKVETMPVYDVLVGIHSLPLCAIEVVAHAGELWVLLGRDVLNAHRLLLDGPGLALEIG